MFVPLCAPSRTGTFLLSEEGAVTVDWTVLTAALVGLGLAVMGVVSAGVGSSTAGISDTLDGSYIGFVSENFGKTPYEVAADVELNHFSSGWTERRMDNLLNEKTDKQLTNQYTRWSSRASDPGYSDPGKAADQVAMIEIAMDARGIAR